MAAGSSRLEHHRDARFLQGRKIRMKETEKTNLDVLLEASFKNCTGPLKERLARKGNLTISEFMLDHVKIGIQELDPELEPESRDFRTAVILMAAAFVVGPHVDRLVQFTGYSMTFVADIARRMQASGLWADGKVRIDNWFDGASVTMAFWADCMVADGVLHLDRTADGEESYEMIE
jgi:hypothetical protein